MLGDAKTDADVMIVGHRKGNSKVTGPCTRKPAAVRISQDQGKGNSRKRSYSTTSASGTTLSSRPRKKQDTKALIQGSSFSPLRHWLALTAVASLSLTTGPAISALSPRPTVILNTSWPTSQLAVVNTTGQPCHLQLPSTSPNAAAVIPAICTSVPSAGAATIDVEEPSLSPADSPIPFALVATSVIGFCGMQHQRRSQDEKSEVGALRQELLEKEATIEQLKQLLKEEQQKRQYLETRLYEREESILMEIRQLKAKMQRAEPGPSLQAESSSSISATQSTTPPAL